MSDGRLFWFVLACAAVSGSMIVADHLTLGTNAFDLSVFDYALWSTTQGLRDGLVPFLGQSLYSHHFMPTLSLLLPVYRLLPSPLFLIGVQVMAFACAGLYVAWAARRQVPPLAAFALTAAFLLGRRAHGMSNSVFYVECLEPIFLFGLVWAASGRRFVIYGIFLLLALGCNENVALYTAAYGLVLMTRRGTRPLGFATVAVSILWVVVAVGVMIPAERALDSLSPDYAFVTERYGKAPVTESLGRLFRFESLRRILSLTLMTGWICWLAPRWLIVVVPGVLLNLAARDDALQSGLVGHYLWPVVPFLFLAAIDGAAFLAARRPRVLRVWAALLIIGVAVESPVLRPHRFLNVWRIYDRAAAVRAELAAIPSEASVLAQPQLVPHIAKRVEMQALGEQELGRPATAQIVVLSRLGDQWPLTGVDFDRMVKQLEDDPNYVRSPAVEDLVMFTKREAPLPP